jgi:hypothetical protein
MVTHCQGGVITQTGDLSIEEYRSAAAVFLGRNRPQGILGAPRLGKGGLAAEVRPEEKGTSSSLPP